jgi:ribosome-binding protein aMBF1 (putative translation factor)
MTTMIKNERQYGITKTQAARFRETLTRLEPPMSDADGSHPLLVKAERDALRGQLETLEGELAEYDSLRASQQVSVAGSFDELPRALIRARIASGLTQKELAARLGVKEQQVQRYEATEYASASLARVRAVIQALGVTVTEEISFASH